MNWIKNIGSAAKSVAKKAVKVVKENSAKACAFVVGALAIAGGAPAHAQSTGNEGVGAIVSALNGLKPDLGTVVTAAIGIALISMGAMVAISIGKKLMGK